MEKFCPDTNTNGPYNVPEGSDPPRTMAPTIFPCLSMEVGNTQQHRMEMAPIYITSRQWSASCPSSIHTHLPPVVTPVLCPSPLSVYTTHTYGGFSLPPLLLSPPPPLHTGLSVSPSSSPTSPPDRPFSPGPEVGGAGVQSGPVSRCSVQPLPPAQSAAASSTWVRAPAGCPS